MKSDFNLFIEQKFTLIATVLGYFFLILSIGAFFRKSTLFFGVVFLIIGIYLAFSMVGIKVDKENKRFKYYTRQFFIKKGSWQSLIAYPDVSVLLVNQKQTTYSGTNAQVTTKSTVYKVFILNKTHREKFFIKEFKTEETAILFAKDFAGRSGTSFVIFSPQISEASLSRRR
jgi:hypothetical protein